MKAAGQSVSAEDTNNATAAFDSLYAKLQQVGLAPFASTAVPEWAQDELAVLIAKRLLPDYGVGGDRAALIVGMAKEARRELATQTSGHRQETEIESDYF